MGEYCQDPCPTLLEAEAALAEAQAQLAAAEERAELLEWNQRCGGCCAEVDLIYARERIAALEAENARLKAFEAHACIAEACPRFRPYKAPKPAPPAPAVLEGTAAAIRHARPDAGPEESCWTGECRHIKPEKYGPKPARPDAADWLLDPESPIPKRKRRRSK